MGRNADGDRRDEGFNRGLRSSVRYLLWVFVIAMLTGWPLVAIIASFAATTAMRRGHIASLKNWGWQIACELSLPGALFAAVLHYASKAADAYGVASLHTMLRLLGRGCEVVLGALVALMLFQAWLHARAFREWEDNGSKLHEHPWIPRRASAIFLKQ